MTRLRNLLIPQTICHQMLARFEKTSFLRAQFGVF
jgi:hypothetical protein